MSWSRDQGSSADSIDGDPVVAAQTNDELARRLEDVRRDLKEDIQTVVALLGTKVEAEILRLQQQAQDERAMALAVRITAIEEGIKERAREEQAKALERERVRAQDKRLVITALIWPLVMSLLQVYLSLKGS